ncbi:MAG: hypothetical protein PW845_02025 [Pseudomonas sp.]|uniref:hypothetical protein n=1 Tax=Pseudomonas abieticivorans TaxID=2931382 RepID=UPI0020BF12FE|nr:hypothetical protein [Pseudomonas sp. PIA16]MDE1164171.1 hypothetical protein [Pseudomonas sp.]
MRLLLVCGLAAMSLAGCISAPNTPNVTLSTSKAPQAYAECVYPKWLKEHPSTTKSGSQNHYRVVVESKINADEILEISKTTTGSKVSLYQRAPLASPFTRSALETAARDCL